MLPSSPPSSLSAYSSPLNTHPSTMPQVPTARGVKIQSAAEAHLLFCAVHLGRLPSIQRRLDAIERQEVVSGAVFIWEERSAATPQTSSKADLDGGLPCGVVSEIERWTDGLRWGPSRVRDDFLFYQEEDPIDKKSGVIPRLRNGQGLFRSLPRKKSDRLVKKTYSVHYYPQILEGKPPSEPARKWHLTSYHSRSSIDNLANVASVPEVHGIVLPDGLFKKARVDKKVANSISNSHNITHSHVTSISVSNITREDAIPSSHVDPRHHQHNLWGSGVIEMGFLHIEHSIPLPPQPTHQHRPPTGYVPQYAYEPSVTEHQQPPLSSVYSHVHSHRGTVVYEDGYADHTGYGTDYGASRIDVEYEDQGRDRNGLYRAHGKNAIPQVALSTGVVSNLSYNSPRARLPLPPHPHHHTSDSIPSLPPNMLTQIQHQHRCSSGRLYSKEFTDSIGRNGIPPLAYTRPEPQPFSTPGQQHDIPEQPYGVPPECHRFYSTSGAFDELRGSGGSGVIRTRRGLIGSKRINESSLSSISPPKDGSGTGTVYFSPYSWPANPHRAKEHVPFVPTVSTTHPIGIPETNFEGACGAEHYTIGHPYQPPEVPICHSRSHSHPLPHPYSEPTIPPPPLGGTSLYQHLFLLRQHSHSIPLLQADELNGVPTTGMAPQSGAGSNAESSSHFHPKDSSTTIPGISLSDSISPSSITSLQCTSAFPYTASSYAESAIHESPHMAHIYGSGQGIPSTNGNAISNMTPSYPFHMAPFLNLDSPPQMSRFCSMSTSFGSGGSRPSGPGGSPELTRRLYTIENGEHSMVDMINLMSGRGNHNGLTTTYDYDSVKSTREATLPSAWNTSITSGGPAPTIASSQLIHLTQLAHPTGIQKTRAR